MPWPHGVEGEPGADHPAVRRAQRLAAELLGPHALEVDVEGVPSTHLDAIAEAGLYGLRVPAAEGGLGAPPAAQRLAVETLAGADPSTWFVWMQHHTPVTHVLASSGAARRYLPALASGALRCGVALSHLRHHPRRVVTATRTGGGWRYDGRIAWYTGVGLTRAFLLAGLTDDDQVVWSLCPAPPADGVVVEQPLRLAALEATRTARVRVDGLVVPDDDVVTVQPYSAWVAEDVRAANVNPATFGIAAAALRGLVAADRGGAAAAAAAATLAGQLAEVRAQAYRLFDDVPAGERLAERIGLKARALDLLLRTTAAYVAAGAGAAMSLDAPAQLLARAALFLVVQAQTAGVRDATLARLAVR